MCSRRLRPFLLLALASLLVPLGFSQADYSTATLKGTVLDPQRLFISGAQVTIKNPSTGFAETVATGMDGEYRFPSLQPGTYQVQAEAHGFAKAAATVTLSVGQIANYDFHLEIGSTSAVLEVSGEAALVQVEQTQQANTITERQVIDLPNLARDLTNSVFTLPGVAKSEAPRAPGLFRIPELGVLHRRQQRPQQPSYD